MAFWRDSNEDSWPIAASPLLGGSQSALNDQNEGALPTGHFWVDSRQSVYGAVALVSRYSGDGTWRGAPLRETSLADFRRLIAIR